MACLFASYSGSQRSPLHKHATGIGAQIRRNRRIVQNRPLLYVRWGRHSTAVHSGPVLSRGSGTGVGDELPTEIDDHFAGAVHFN